MPCRDETNGTRQTRGMGFRNGWGHGQSQRRKLTADLMNPAWGASVPQISCGPFGRSAGTIDKSVPANASLSGSMSCGVSILESMIYPPIVHETLQVVMKGVVVCTVLTEGSPGVPASRPGTTKSAALGRRQNHVRVPVARCADPQRASLLPSKRTDDDAHRTLAHPQMNRETPTTIGQVR